MFKIIDFKDLLNLLVCLPLLCIAFVLFIPKKKERFLKIFVLNATFLILSFSMLLWIIFRKDLGAFQFVTKIEWFSLFNINFTLGIDGISLFFILLSTFLIPINILISWLSEAQELKFYFFNLLLLEFFLLGTFCVLDLLLFYIFFEAILLPMFLIIGFWGKNPKRVKASYFFFLYTLFGSIFMLLGIFYIYYQAGTSDLQTLLAFEFSFFEEKVMWFIFFLSFASKIPMVPFHLWLPEAHVEAPTTGSVILAGILLKLGTYGFIRFLLPLFPKASFFFAPLVYTLSILGVIYASLTATRQSDFKKTVAYSSIAHMNLVVVGIFSFNFIGIQGAIYQSLSHGFVASALFFIIGIVYDRHKTRVLKYYSGLVHLMPLYSAIFLFFTMSNIGLPGTGGFVGEFLILLGSIKVNTVSTFFSGLGVVLSSCYSLWLFNRIVYGNLKTQYSISFIDLNKLELLVFMPLILGTIFMGLVPEIFVISIRMSLNFLIELLYF